MVRWQADRLVHQPNDVGFDPFGLARVRRTSLSHNHQSFGPAFRIDAAKRGHTTPAHAGRVRRRQFHLLRDDVVAGLDDAILLAPGDVDLAVGQVAQVAGVHPSVLVDHGGRGLGIAKVALGLRRPPKEHASLDALGDVLALVINDANLVAGQRLAVGDEAQYGGGVGPRRDRASFHLEVLSRDHVDTRCSVDGRERQRHRRLGQAVTWHVAFGTESVAPEALSESG